MINTRKLSYTKPLQKVIIESILDSIKAYPKERSDPLPVLNLQDEDGNTALHLSISESRADILKELLPLNPLMNLKNNSG